ncbi:YfcE family phosphodiesterase [Aminithiophilus ramosus]|uniref:Phosphoesterase n=1 Tax=Aminithiophilus ramosus TaxID=3029084 RepID=A0A9Q7AAD5_9BACT|nr:YfcE family phosphodiesterase [Aminithiophilus ramosus]QTX33375.1 YfcE family phosphodiesterase [Aminithiophilus ramosus]
MRVTLISDVHGNLPALEAVLAHARARRGGPLWNGGDDTGYGPFPHEVLALLRPLEKRAVRGNYDEKVLKAPVKSEAWYRKKNPLKARNFIWTHDALDDADRAYLASLPRQLAFDAAGLRVLLVHASPLSSSEPLGPDTPDERLAVIAAEAKADLVVVGHSHRPFARRVGGTWFVNPGSVGRPEGGDPRASYALLDIVDGRVYVTHHRVAYDVSACLAALRRAGLPEGLGRVLAEGRSLDELEARRDERGQETLLRQGWRLLRSTCAAPDDARRDPLEAVLETATRLVPHEMAHLKQVTGLALRLFDDLRGLHGLGERDRLRLQCAALLHDIGWARGGKKHHTRALSMILQERALPFSCRDRCLIGSVARYHRRSLPRERHFPWCLLGSDERRKVVVLSALLRVADGLDYSHIGLVDDVTAAVKDDRVVLSCLSRRKEGPDLKRALEKGADPFRQAFGKELRIRWERV